MDRSLDEAKENVLKAVEEARSEIPQFIAKIGSSQEECIQFAQEIAENYINAQKDILIQCNLIASLLGKCLCIVREWLVVFTTKMIEAYATMVVVLQAIHSEQLGIVNNDMLAHYVRFQENSGTN